MSQPTDGPQLCGPCTHERHDLCFGPFQVGVTCTCDHEQRAQLRCPIWCQTDHPTADPHDEYISEDGFVVYRLRHHSHDVAQVPNPGAGDDKLVYVSVSIEDDLETGKRSGPHVMIDGAECMNLTTARVVAAAVHQACSVASDTRPAA